MSRTVSNGSAPTENISISIPEPLLVRVDKYGLRQDLTRSQIISRAIRRFLAAELADDPAFWTTLYDQYEEEGKI